MIDKLCASAVAAVADVPDGATVITPDGVVVVESVEGPAFDELQARTGVPLVRA